VIIGGCIVYGRYLNDKVVVSSIGTFRQQCVYCLATRDDIAVSQWYTGVFIRTSRSYEIACYTSHRSKVLSCLAQHAQNGSLSYRNHKHTETLLPALNQSTRTFTRFRCPVALLARRQRVLSTDFNTCNRLSTAAASSFSMNVSDVLI
jgi:hypothetical protein